jgi:hypothetical protein
MAKTRQNNIDSAFQSTEKLQLVIDKLAVSLDKLDTSLANATIGKSQADIERENAEKKKAAAETRKADAAEKAALAAEKRATDDKDLTDFINKTVKDSEVSMDRMKNFIGDDFSKNFTKVISSELNLDSESLAIDKKIAGELGDIFENIENIGTDKFKAIDVDGLKAKRKQFEEAGASPEFLEFLDQGIDSAEAMDISLGSVEKTMKGITDVGNELIKPFKEIPVLGPMISGALDKGLGKATDMIRKKLVGQIFMAGKGTKALKKGFLSSIPPINMMGTSIHVATGGLTLLIGLLVAAAAALIGMAKRARDFATENNVAFSQSLKLQGSIMKANVQLVGTGKDASKIAGEMIDAFGRLDGINANNIKNIGKLATRFGTSTKDIITFQKAFGDLTGASADQANDVVRAVGQMATGAGVAAGKVIADISSNMESFAKFSTMGAEGLAQAAVEAAKVGGSLSVTMTAAGKLLDFESSLTAEYEAQVLTGKTLNFERARQLALEGDIGKLTTEISKQIGSVGDIGKMNAIAKQSLADTIGISVGDLMKISRGEAAEVGETQEDLQRKTNDILTAGFQGNKDELTKLNSKPGNGDSGMYDEFNTL